MNFKVGDRVLLPATDLFSEEKGTIIEMIDGRITCVKLDPEFIDYDHDDGLIDIGLEDAIKLED